MIEYDVDGIGRRVHHIRRARRMTLKQVEAAVGVSATHVSEIERGRTSPTVRALTRIARALGVDVADLLESIPLDTLHVSRSDGRMPLRSDDGVEFSALSAGRPESGLSFLEVRVPPGAHPTLRGDAAPGEEIVVARRGRVRVSMRARSFVLDPGQTLHFRSDGGFTVAPEEQEPVTILWATRPPLLW